ncbi:hypothetical protein [Mycolicibacterium alvei]|uniref:hypothetical protein n=1 Tax=Mycolicibacterium alvei TaxID=67081 RepID=UPI0013D15360|nr:hypothetical protein [Mycolicibacterium alvei]MCV6999747.1 hypothetical protein [Mycolicibacterium alvei]
MGGLEVARIGLGIVAADAVTLSPDQLSRLDILAEPAGDHHTAAQTWMIDR